ncbi:hypothetical protein TWF694_001699 [Orbilia ellipsospora]|uniref:Uncharacterized protein n=1 Tax=Orbilia ellipsospora TaxID=2528407 RepID=A0AAV9X3F3_9PEZI
MIKSDDGWLIEIIWLPEQKNEDGKRVEGEEEERLKVKREEKEKREKKCRRGLFMRALFGGVDVGGS